MTRTAKAARTKERILDAALQMFNAHGVAHVSLGHIAAEISISLGNLNYHYRDKSSLVEGLFDRLQTSVQEELRHAPVTDLASLDRMLCQSAAIQQRYVFFYADVIEIDRRHPGVAALHTANALRRRLEFQRTAERCVDGGWMRPAAAPATYEQMAHALWYVMTFWISEHVMQDRPLTELARAFEVTRGVLWSIIRPHLTSKGRRALDGILSRPASET